MNRPTFSLVIPAYNAAATIGDAIRSVLNQTVADFEVIVVDDGSTDATSTEIARFAGDPRVRPFRQPNGGVSAARNRALAEACGRYASFLDADDLLLPRYLEVMGHTLDRIPEAAVADCDFWILHDADGAVSCSPAGHLELPAAPDELMRVLLKRNVLHYATTVRMDVLRDVGAFDPALRAAEDLELWLRILAHSIREAIADGMREYRLGRGDEEYKHRFTDDRSEVATAVLVRGVKGRIAAQAARSGWARRLVRPLVRT